MRRIISVIALVGSSLFFTGFAQSQEETTDTEAAQEATQVQEVLASTGAKIKQIISEKVSAGATIEDATRESLALLTSSEDDTLSLGEKDVLTTYIGAGAVFFGQLAGGIDMFEATMATIEALPDQAVGVVTLAVTFFPEAASDIIAAAGLTGEISEEDAIAVALAAGANIDDVSAETAAGGELAAVPTPLGAGVGAGGTGGGDTTASTN